MHEIVLASASPRRRELLAKAGVTFTVRTADTDESTKETDPAKVVEELSSRKAGAVLSLLQAEGTIGEVKAIIGADTIVAKDGLILGKPSDEEDALRMLRLLSGDTHQVFTGVTMIFRKEDANDPAAFCRLTFSERTDVTFYPVAEEVLKAYIATGEPMDKAGAYGIQGTFGLFAQGITGDIDNVIGLPVPRLLHEASKAGLILTKWQGGH